MATRTTEQWHRAWSDAGFVIIQQWIAGGRTVLRWFAGKSSHPNQWFNSVFQQTNACSIVIYLAALYW